MPLPQTISADEAKKMGWGTPASTSSASKGGLPNVISADQAKAMGWNTMPDVSPNQPIQEEHGSGLAGMGGSMVAGLLKTPARLATNLINAGQIITGNKPTQPFDSKFLGEVKPVGESGNFGQDLKDATGAGLEMSSYLVGGGEAKGATTALKEGSLLAKPFLKAALSGAKSGAIIGALGGAGSELQNPNSTIGSTAIQGGLGALTGAGTGGLLETGGKLLEKIGILNKLHPEAKNNAIIQNRLNELDKLDAYNSLSKVVQKNKDRGINVKDIIAKTDLLQGSVDKNGTIITKGEGNAIDQVQQFIKPQEAVIANNLEKEGVSLTPEQVKQKLVSKIESSGISGKARTTALNNVDAEIGGYRLDDKGKIPLAELQVAKVDKYDGINFMSDPEKQKYDKSIAQGLKQLIQENTKSVEVEKLNKELSKHYAVIDYLSKLDGKKVEGGKLGKYFAQTIGSIVGGHFGPLGSIVGAEVGGGLKGASMASTFGGKIGKGLEQSAAMREAIAKGNAPLPQLEAPKVFYQGAAKTPTTYESPAQRIFNQSKINEDKLLPAGISKSQGVPIILPRSARETNLGLDEVRNTQSLKSLGNRQINQATTTEPIMKGISEKISQDSKISKQLKALKNKK